eukprot:TRINITY_DN4851_c0_g2_i8.p1 TRINITY_DN4851_c0_g2~~TRINITY_DN4851_c0_g2_i8.p1  ORF type:complete len:159 (+),score=28.58 TRINITY_DN4851_c0_g2_i8:92-568(+)
MIRRPPRSTLSSSSAASDVYKRQSFMCGRSRAAGTMASYSTAVRNQLNVPLAPQTDGSQWTPSHNLHPGQQVPVLTSEEGQLVLRPMRWGLHPSFSKPDSKPDFFRMFNCRSESCDTSPVNLILTTCSPSPSALHPSPVLRPSPLSSPSPLTLTQRHV